MQHFISWESWAPNKEMWRSYFLLSSNMDNQNACGRNAFLCLLEEQDLSSRRDHMGNQLHLALLLITWNGPWEWELSEHLPSLWNQQHRVVALPGTVLAGLRSLLSCPLPFPSFHPGLLPVEIEPMQTEPWSRPAACSDCLPWGAAGPHYAAAVSITKKEKSQLSIVLRTRTFASPGKQIANVWPTWSSWFMTGLSQEIFFKSQFYFIFFLQPLWWF